MDREQIKQIIPHREPMLLVDEAYVEDGKSIGKYTVRGDEFFLQGHFPNNPVVPGVILCEMMAQSTCVLISENTSGKTPYFVGLDKVKFKNKVLVGDTITFECELVKQKFGFCFFRGVGKANGTVCVTGEFSVAIV